MPAYDGADADWLRERYPVMTDINELVDDYEREFGVRPTKRCLYMRANKLGLRKRKVNNRTGKHERAVHWSREPEKMAWMREHDHGQRTDRLSDEFRERFGFGLTRSQITLYRSTYGSATRPSHNDGMEVLPVGTERARKDGYVFVKVAERPAVGATGDNWVLKHVQVWEQHHGREVDRGHVVMFADGDKLNFDVDNLVLVPRRLVGVINSLKAAGYGWHDRETLETVVAMAELRMGRNDAIASIRRTCPICGKSFDNRSRRHGGNINSTICPECGAKGLRPQHTRKPTYDHDEIRRLHAAGASDRDIARRLGCAPSTVYYATHGAKVKQQRRERGRKGKETA